MSSQTQTFILMGWREYLYISVFIWYENSFTQIKWWNAHEVTQNSSGDVVHVFMSSLRRHALFSVCVQKENTRLCHPFIEIWSRDRS